MDYYPHVKTFKSYDKNTCSNLYTLVTNIRFKHEDGFYYLVTYKIQTLGLETISDKIYNQVWQKLIVDVEDLRNNYQYNPNNKVSNPIDPYQGEIGNYNPEIRFRHYDPDLSFDELQELNQYMKEF